MFTPPRPTKPKLPSSSPPSARLRRLAPSPVKIPPPPQFGTPSRPRRALFNASPRATDEQTPKVRQAIGRSPSSPSTTSRRSRTSGADPFEYDFMPLERTIVLDTRLDASRQVESSHKDRRRQLGRGMVMPSTSMASLYASSTEGASPSGASSSADRHRRHNIELVGTTIDDDDATNSIGRASIPVIFDFHGRFGALAEKQRLSERQRGKSSRHRRPSTAPAAAESEASHPRGEDVDVDEGIEEEIRFEFTCQSPDVPESIRNPTKLPIGPISPLPPCGGEYDSRLDGGSNSGISSPSFITPSTRPSLTHAAATAADAVRIAARAIPRETEVIGCDKLNQRLKTTTVVAAAAADARERQRVLLIRDEVALPPRGPTGHQVKGQASEYGLHRSDHHCSKRGTSPSSPSAPSRDDDESHRQVEPKRVLVEFNENVFAGVTPDKEHKSRSKSASRDALHSAFSTPSIGVNTTPRPSVSVSYKSIDPDDLPLPPPPSSSTMSSLNRVIAASRSDRDLSVTESFYTFGRPDRRPSAASIDDDGWSYSLSAYGDDDETPSSGIDIPGPSRKSSGDSCDSNGSPTSLLIPDFVPFIPPSMPYTRDQHGSHTGSESTLEVQTPRFETYPTRPSRSTEMEELDHIPTDGSRSGSPTSYADSSELFTPNYSVATLPRPSVSSSFCSDPYYASSQGKVSGESSRSNASPFDPDYSMARPLLTVDTSQRHYEQPSPRTRVSVDTLEPLGTIGQATGPIPNRHSRQPIPSSTSRYEPTNSFLAPESSHSPAASPTSSVSSRPQRASRVSSTGSDQNIPPYIAEALRSVEKSTTITLIVDQEGAREVQTTLKYMRVHKPQVWREKELKALEEAALWCESPSRPEPFQATGCIEFGMDPKARAKWTFHHAALEGLPVLRRVIVRDQDKHDYLSRGATLQIRDSGVYAVYGTEDKGRIEWKFEYLVQPKFSRHTGEPISGEKIIIPLGFYVSPAFFNPERAIKLHLLNVFKKQLTPNLVSEKVRPPHIGTPPVKEPPSHPTSNLLESTTSRATCTSTSSAGSGNASASASGSGGGGFAKALARVKSNRSATSTPTETKPFGVKDANARPNSRSGRPGSRSRTPTLGGFKLLHTDDESDTPRSEKKPLRRRATTLFSRSNSRPFTPPANITDTHPVPTLHPMKSLSALSSRRPHTAQATLRGEAPSFPQGSRGMGQGHPPTPPVPSRSRPATANAEVPPVPRMTTNYHMSSHPFSTNVRPVSSQERGRQRPSTAQAQVQVPITPRRKPQRPSTALGGSSETTPAGVNLVTPARHGNVHTPGRIVPGRALVITPEDRMMEAARNWAQFPSPGSESEESLQVQGHGGKGLPPAPRRGVMRTRPSTAQPRLGVAV